MPCISITMRDEVNPELDVGGILVGEAIRQVEAEVRGWSKKYQHITHAVAVQRAQIIQLETIFSKPTQEKPVPVAVVCVYFSFDTRTSAITYRFEQESVRHRISGMGLAPSRFESWLDRIISDKLQVRLLHGLATPFEETRLAPPPLLDEDEPEEAEAEEGPEDDGSGAPTKGGEAAGDHEKIGLPVLLANIFDAADEEDEFELTHKEVADLLYATPLGLADWDIKLLLTMAPELETGKIEYKPFVQAAPEFIEALLKRRAAYKARQQPTAVVTHEAIDLCFGEEIEEAGRAAREAFSAADTKQSLKLSRHEFRTRLDAISQRFSTQEVQMVMQMCKECDSGQVPYDEFVYLLQHLRVEALHNALVETDVSLLRAHLIVLLRREAMNADGVISVWTLKHVLLGAEQLCLSRMQIHVILSIVHPNEYGEVDAEYFLRVACTVIPSMFDAATFMEKASSIREEKDEAQKRAEAQELEAFTTGISASRNRGSADNDDAEDTQANAPDRDAVEKHLIHVCGQHEDKHRQQPTLQVGKFLDAMHPDSVQQCQLQDHELRGFIAEAEIVERDEVAYVEHVKTWVPIIFELRRSHVYDAILSKDWGFEADHLVDLREYESQFPLHLSEEHQDRPRSGRRPSSQGRGRLSRSGSRVLGAADIKNLRRPSSKDGNRKSVSARPRSRERSLSRANSSRTVSRANSNRSLNQSNSQESLESVASRRSSVRGGSR